MKKIIGIIVLFGILNQANSQDFKNGFSKGSLFLTGSIGFSALSQDKLTSNEVSFIPKAATFITSHIAAGVSLGWGQRSSSEDTLKTVNETKFNAGLFARYYFTPASQFSLFGEFGVDFADNQDKLGKKTTQQIGVGISPGINYFLSDRFSMEATIGRISYSRTTTKVNNQSQPASSSFGLNVSLTSINLGLIVRLKG